MFSIITLGLKRRLGFVFFTCDILVFKQIVCFSELLTYEMRNSKLYLIAWVSHSRLPLQPVARLSQEHNNMPTSLEFRHNTKHSIYFIYKLLFFVLNINYCLYLNTINFWFYELESILRSSIAHMHAPF